MACVDRGTILVTYLHQEGLVGWGRSLGHFGQFLFIDRDAQSRAVRYLDMPVDDGHEPIRDFFAPEVREVDMIDGGHREHGGQVGKESQVDRTATLLDHHGHLDVLHQGSHPHGIANGSMTGHVAIYQPGADEIEGNVVSEDGSLYFPAKGFPALAIRGHDGVFESSRHREVLQLFQEREDVIEERVGIQVVVNLEPPWRDCLHGPGLLDDILNFVRVVLEPAVAHPGCLANLGCHGRGGLRHGPERYGYLVSHLGPDEFPGGQLQVLAHQVVEGHVDGQVAALCNPVKWTGTQVGLQVIRRQGVFPPAFSIAGDPHVRGDHVNGSCLDILTVIAEQGLPVVITVWRIKGYGLDGLNSQLVLSLADSPALPGRQRRRPGQRKPSQDTGQVSAERTPCYVFHDRNPGPGEELAWNRPTGKIAASDRDRKLIPSREAD